MTLTARFVIFARKADGSVFECFRWTRDEASGIARAKDDAARFGIECSEFWAEAV